LPWQATTHRRRERQDAQGKLRARPDHEILLLGVAAREDIEVESAGEVPAARLEDHHRPVLLGLVECRVQRVQHRQRHHIGLAVADHDAADRSGTGIDREFCHGNLLLAKSIHWILLCSKDRCKGFGKPALHGGMDAYVSAGAGRARSSPGLSGRSGIPETAAIDG